MFRAWSGCHASTAVQRPTGYLLLLLACASCAASAQTDPTMIDWAERIEVASGDAYQGPWRMNESDFRFVDDPAVAISSDGAIGVAWVDQARKEVLFQVFEPNGAARLPEPANVSGSPHIFSWLPRVILTGGDPSAVYILWQEIVFSGGSHGGEIFFSRSTDGGRTFAHPINLSNTIAGAGKGRLTPRIWENGSLDLAMDPAGDLYAAWTEYEGALRFSRSTDGGESFSAPLHIAGGGRELPARGPSLAVAPDGMIHLAWSVGEDPAAGVRMAISDDRGLSFRESRAVLESDGHADAPRIAVDPDGTLHLVYAERPPGRGQGYQVRYSRSVDGGHHFEAPREISRAQGSAGAGYPALGLDGEGGLYVLWELFQAPASRPVGLGFTTSRDGGRTFAEPTVLPGSHDPALGVNGSGQGLFSRKLAVNEKGEVAVVNSTFRRNASSHVFLFRGRVAAHP